MKFHRSILLLTAAATMMMMAPSLLAATADNLEFWLRTNRWQLIQKTYGPGKSKAKSALERYALAKAYQKKPPAAFSKEDVALFSLRILLGDQSQQCEANFKKEERFINCLKRKSVENVAKDADKLVLLEAANFATAMKWYKLKNRILELIELDKDIFHSEEIVAPRLALMHKLDLSRLEMRSFIYRYKELIELSPYALYQRGYIEVKLGQKTKALQSWVRAFSHPNCEAWLQKDIMRDLKKTFAGFAGFAGKASKASNHKSANIRLLTAFSSHLPKKVIANLKKKIPSSDILKGEARKQHPYLLAGDGYFLIEIKRFSDFLKLVGKNQKSLIQDPTALIGWANYLSKKKHYSVLLAMAEKFPRLKTESISYYRSILRAHEKKSSKKLGLVYFEELLAFINANPYATPEHDKLIDFLVKSSNGKIQSYASKIYWKKAAKELPQHHSSGRFFYWLARYYEAKNMPQEKNTVQRELYQSAPGSYYTYAFTDGHSLQKGLQNQSQSQKKEGTIAQTKILLKKARQDWRRNVRDRNSYLQWLSKYGSLPAEKIASYKRNQFLDPKAIELNAKIRKSRVKFSDPLILTLLKFGKWRQTLQVLKKTHYRTLPRDDYYIAMIRLGRQTEHLNFQVYYTKALLNEHKVSIDPFSLPKHLLELLYPRPYQNMVRQYTQTYKLEPAVVYAIMRQESLFRPGARSRSDARGLMQILPSTGNWLRKLLKAPVNNLFDPKYNIRLGSYYFSRLLKSYDNDFNWAAIAYNGGPGNLSSWKKKYLKDNDFYLFLESLPVTESRNYCRIVLKNYRDYQLMGVFH